MKAGKWKLYGIAILFISIVFLGKDKMTEVRIRRGMSKILEQYPELHYDKSVIETETVLKSLFKDQMPADNLLQMTLTWKNNQWNLTSLTGMEAYLNNPAVQKILYQSLPSSLPSPANTSPEGWFPQRFCEIVRMGPDLKIIVNQGIRDSFPKERKVEYLSPFRDFGYPVGQSPREDRIQIALKQQEIHLQENEKTRSFLGEALIIRNYGPGSVKVDISIPHMGNQIFEEGLEGVLNSHFQDLMKFSSSVTFSIKDELGEAEKEYSPEGITEEKRWILRLPHEDGFLYYLEPFLD